MKCIVGVAILVCVASWSVRGADPAPSFRQYGTETLTKIHSSFHLPDRSLYTLEANSRRRNPCWIWDASIQLGALCSAARVDPAAYLPQVKSYAVALRSYRTTHNNRPGLDVNPGPKPPDRYYDDNAWISLSLLEAYELTRDAKDLELAREALEFALSGEDDKSFGGGIFWREEPRASKNSCTSGPAMLAAMRFHKLTGDKKYLAITRRLYDWTRKTLQDEDGLVFDSISVSDGRIDRRKFSYNSATLIHAACLLHQATGEKAYLEEARRVAKAAEGEFVRAADGIITGSGKLGVKLVEALLVLAEADNDRHRRETVARCLKSLHGKKSEAGWYPDNWGARAPNANRTVRLIDQSAPARAYWLAAENGLELK